MASEDERGGLERCSQELCPLWTGDGRVCMCAQIGPDWLEVRAEAEESQAKAEWADGDLRT